jgi:hypothetical protein
MRQEWNFKTVYERAMAGRFLTPMDTAELFISGLDLGNFFFVV